MRVWVCRFWNVGENKRNYTHHVLCVCVFQVAILSCHIYLFTFISQQTLSKHKTQKRVTYSAAGNEHQRFGPFFIFHTNVTQHPVEYYDYIYFARQWTSQDTKCSQYMCVCDHMGYRLTATFQFRLYFCVPFRVSD